MLFSYFHSDNRGSFCMMQTFWTQNVVNVNTDTDRPFLEESCTKVATRVARKLQQKLHESLRKVAQALSSSASAN